MQEQREKRAMCALREIWEICNKVLTDIVAEIDIEFVDIPANDAMTAFRIGKYPVTNAQYKAFMDATGYKQPRHWIGNMYPDGKGTCPVVCVSWYDAAAFCEWTGVRLPTEEEWEYAATGGDEHEYPWGNGFDADKCNTREGEVGDTTPVGTYSPQGDSPFGIADMAGNVWEWIDSEESIKPLRGGSWFSDQRGARVRGRSGDYPDLSVSSVGCRVVASPASSDS